MSIVLTGEDRWVACSKAEFGPPGEHRHIIRRGGITTVCGATGMPATLWRGNTRKPMCPECVDRYGKREQR